MDGGLDAGMGGGLASKLAGREFLSESLEGWELVPDTEIRVSFTETDLGVHAGCNHLGGSYRIEGDVLRMEGFSSTAIGCEPRLHEQDGWVQELLTASPTITLDEPRLTVDAGDDRLVLLDREIASPDRPLVGTDWVGNGIADDRSVSFGPGAELVRVSFGEDGRVEVFTACQTGQGTFTADDTTIELPDLSYDGAACTDSRNLIVSNQVLSVLDGSPLRYEIDEDNLTLDGGGLRLLFAEGSSDPR